MNRSMIQATVVVALAACSSSQRGERAAPAAGTPCCAVVELRQYTLRPGQRDTLIELFDRELIEIQEAGGMMILGQFRDLDRPDRFVWLRGYTDMATREATLTAFYGGPSWKAHSRAANATMIDVANVLLLRPAAPGSAFSIDRSRRPPPGATTSSSRLVIATVWSFPTQPDAELVAWFDREVAPQLTSAGATILARLVTEPSPNTFPSLPIREGEHVLVYFTSFADLPAYERHLAELSRSATWQATVSPGLATRQNRPPEILRLEPTARSLVGR